MIFLRSKTFAFLLCSLNFSELISFFSEYHLYKSLNLGKKRRRKKEGRGEGKEGERVGGKVEERRKRGRKQKTNPSVPLIPPHTCSPARGYERQWDQLQMCIFQRHHQSPGEFLSKRMINEG